MEAEILSGDLIVAEVLARWPQATPVLIRRRLICPGCVMSRFETLAEVAANYGLDLDDLLRELRQAIAAPIRIENTEKE